jgi:hypothetical protein
VDDIVGLWISEGFVHGTSRDLEELGREYCWKYALEPTGFDPQVGSDGFDPLWCKSPNGPQML